MLRKLRKMGQSTVEFVIILTVIIAAVLAAALYFGQDDQGIKQLFTNAALKMTTETDKLDDLVE